MTAYIQGMDELAKTLQRLPASYQAAATKVVNRTAQNVRNDAIKLVQRPSASGETYRKYNPRRDHTASAPGSPPNTDTGILAGSIRATETGTPTATVEAQAEYAKWLEFGTFRTAARPFMTPAVESNRKQYKKDIAKAINDIGRRAGS